MNEKTSQLGVAIAALEREYGCRFCLHGLLGGKRLLPELSAMHLNPYCSALKRRYPHYENLCLAYDHFELQERLRAEPREAVRKLCPMGCLELVFPVRLETRLLGMLFCGPFRPAGEPDLPPGKLYDCALAAKEFAQLPKLSPRRERELAAFGAVLAGAVAARLAAGGVLDDTANFIEDFLARRLARPCGIGELADALKLGRSRTSELVRKHFGVTFTELLNRRRIDRAKLMLSETSYSQRQIAILCGFRDPAYLHRVFRRLTGEAPGDYRRRHRNRNASPADGADGDDAV